MCGDTQSSICCAVLQKILYALPVVFIFLITGWSYYAYIWPVCLFSMNSIVEQTLCLITFHILLLLFLSNYMAAVFTKPRLPPNNHKLTNDEYLAAIRGANNPPTTDDDKSTEESPVSKLSNYIRERNLKIKTTDEQSRVRFCVECLYLKPDRTHHCSTCGHCLLKMDHHCPWVNNCVGFHNYKFFVVFLFWGTIYCFFVAFSTLPYFIEFWSDPKATTMPAIKFQILFLFLVAIVFALSQLFLLCNHVYLIWGNKTTLESFRSPTFSSQGADSRGYDLGVCENYKQVFGTNCLLWGLPIFTSLGNGYEWPTRADSESRLEQGTNLYATLT